MRVLHLLALSAFSLFLSFDGHAKVDSAECSQALSQPGRETESLATAENEALAALQQMVFSPAQARTEIQSWLDQLRMKQSTGKTLTIFEHTALSYLLRGNFFNAVADAAERDELTEILKTSWFNLTHIPLTADNYLGRLPKRVLYGQSREVLLFHFASFEKDGRREGLLYPSPFENYVPERHDWWMASGASAAFTALAFSQTGSSMLASVLSGYLIVSTVEHVIHRYVGHPNPLVTKIAAHLGWVGKALRDTTFSHAIVHHIKTYRQHTTQFEHDDDEDDLDIELENNPNVDEAVMRDLRGSRYGVTIRAKGVGIILGVTAPVLFAMSRFLDLDAPSTTALMAPLAVQVLTPKYLHEFVHTRRSEALDKANPFTRWLLNTRLVELISRSHYLHHRGGGGNYNLVFGADWLLGQFRRPNLRQVFRMRELEVIGTVWTSPSSDPAS